MQCPGDRWGLRWIIVVFLFFRLFWAKVDLGIEPELYPIKVPVKLT